MRARRTVLKEFPESIVDRIRVADHQDMFAFADLIKKTLIERNHDAIIAAWRRRLEELRLHVDNELGVPESVLAQKDVVIPLSLSA